jgi:alpha-beta hydrolase superfamily lysophospholipase
LAEPVSENVALADGTCRTQMRRWPTVGTPLGSIVLLHGIQSHGGWYLNSCARLADAGFEVWLPDRRGSGKNLANRGDAPSFRRLVDDAAEIMQRTKPPRFLAGISWGGKLAVAMQRRHSRLSDGLILITPGLCQRVGLPFRDRLSVFFSRWVAPTKLFPIPLNDPSLFTKNSEFQRFIRHDPVGLQMATARLLFESARLDIYNRWAAKHVTCPTLVLFAEHDRIIDNAKTRRFVARFPSRDVTIREYRGAHHTLEFEPGGPPFIEDLLAWLRDHCPKSV